MSNQLIYFFFFILTLSILLAIMPTRNLIKSVGFEKLLGITSAYILALTGLKGTSTEVLAFKITWEQASPFLIFTSISLMVGGLIISAIRNIKNKPISNLQSKFKLLREEYYKLCSDNLRVIFKDFTSNSNSTRISMYKFEDSHFKLIGRYSKSPKYNKKGRLEYPCEEGFIAIGWSDGEFIIHGITSYEVNGKEHIQKIQEKCNIKTRTLKNMKMKSCSFYVKTIENEDSRQPLGIIVAEQLSPSPIDKIEIDKMIQNNVEILRTIYKSMKSLHD